MAQNKYTDFFCKFLKKVLQVWKIYLPLHQKQFRIIQNYNINNFKFYSYDKEIQMLGLRLYS